MKLTDAVLEGLAEDAERGYAPRRERRRTGLRATTPLARAQARQAQALAILTRKTHRAALRLQALLGNDEIIIPEGGGRVYRTLHVSWPVSRPGVATKYHPGAEVLAVSEGRTNWTLLYDPREQLREIDTQTIWDVELSGGLLNEGEQVVTLPTAATLILFARDFSALIGARLELAQEATTALQTAIKELDHGQDES